jgi:hypothetical protein
MRDWIFDGRRFMSPDVGNQEKADLLVIMNDTPEAIKNGQRLLKDLKKYADSHINLIASSTMNIESDGDARRKKLANFAKETESFQIAKIKNTTLGNGIIAHYKKKFKAVRKTDAAASALLMMIGDKIWLVDKTPTFNAGVETEIAKHFGTTKIPTMGQLEAQLEVRIQPRGLSAPGKRVSIDVMASFRLSGALSGGIAVK